jgi:hypothetical protein
MPRHLAPIVLACCVGWSVSAAETEQHDFILAEMVATIFSTSGVREYTLVILDVMRRFKDGSAVRRERSS